MTAIAAAIHWNGRPVEPTVLGAMNRCVEYRCPDGGWVWAEGAAGLAQVDLATLPEDDPGTPVVMGHLRIAASCRIDNRADVLRALPRTAHPPAATDAALILAAYAVWGEACLDRLVGDFAFVIWDEVDRTLFAARDPSGSRQLFYYSDPTRLLIASDLTQILQDPTVPLVIDEAQVLEYLTPIYRWYNGWDQGCFHGFRSLPAGTYLRATHDHVSVQQFWHVRDAVPDQRSEDDWLAEYLDTFTEAVRCRLRSRTPQLAMELSGGLDSPAIASVAARLSERTDRELHTYSLVFDDVPEVDERSRIQPVVDRYQLHAHMLPADRLYLPQCMSPVWAPRSIVGPQELRMPLAVTELQAHALADGCRILLTGDSGDAVNGGSALVYFDLLRRRDWRGLARYVQQDARRSWQQAVQRSLVYGLTPFAPWPVFASVLGLWERHKGSLMPFPSYLAPDLQRQIHELDAAIRLHRVQEVKARCPVVRGTLSAIFPPMALQTLTLPHPIERRHPYMDRRLVELVLSMPASMKWDPTEPTPRRACRWHHRRAMRDILPDVVRVGNDGADFTSVIQHSCSSKAIQEWFSQSTSIHIFDRGYVQPQRFWEAVARPDQDHGYLITLLCLEGWLRALEPPGAMRQLIPPRAVSA